jgi:peptidyl-prolyl cis-trans isomerase D
MLQLMRHQLFIKILMWTVIIAFVAWLGMELGYGGGPQGSNPEVGMVADEPIYWIAYRRQIAEMRDYQRRQANQIVDEFDLDEQVWQQNVRGILLRKAVERMGLNVSSDEVAEGMVNNPPGGFEQVPDFQTDDGTFNRDAYRQFLAGMTQQQWFQITGLTFAEYEDQVRFNMLVQKLRHSIEMSAWVSESELRQAYADQNEKVKLRVIAAPVSLVDDAEIEVSEDDIRSYYQSHLSEYAQSARAMLQYVVIPRKPSIQDSVAARNQIWDIYNRIKQGADFAELAQLFSEDESNASDGGNLGTFARGTMVPAFDEAAFSTRAGRVAEPVHTRFGWHVIKVERKVKSPADSVEARHILIRDTEPGLATTDSLQAVAEKLAAAGTHFEETVVELGLNTSVTPWFDTEVTYPVPQVGETLRRLVRWAFVGEIDSVASPHMTDNEIIVAQIEARRQAGPRDLSEVRAQIETKLRVAQKVAKAAEMLRPVADNIAQSQPMDAAVHGTDFSVIDLGPFGRTQYLPEVEAGAFDSFIGAAFTLAHPGDMTGLIEVPERGAYIMTLVERTLDEDGFESQREQLSQRLLRRKSQAMFADWDWFNRENAEIEDLRDDFYQYN